MLIRAPAAQRLHRITRRADTFDDEIVEDVYFVPFVGT